MCIGQNVPSTYVFFPPVTDKVTVIALGRCLLTCKIYLNSHKAQFKKVVHGEVTTRV